MSKCILVRSVTYAQKAHRLLTDNKIKSVASKQLKASRYGCAWCITVNEYDLQASLDILRIGGVKTTGDVYDVYK